MTLKQMHRRLTTTMLRVLPQALQERLVLAKLPQALDVPNDLVVKVADQISEYSAAAALTFEAYAEKELVNARGVPVRVTPFLMMPTTVRLVAISQGEVIATMALIVDSPLGLPMENVFGPEITALRRQGRRMVEGGTLAIAKAHRRSGIAMLMYKAVYLTAFELLGLDELLGAVHPDAEPMYVCPLRFERLTPQVRPYPGLTNGARALGMHLNLETFREVLWQKFQTQRPGLFNPYAFFFRAEHAQLRLPKDVKELESVRRTHRQATLRLACLRPDIVAEMGAEQFNILSNALTEPSTGSHLRLVS